MIINFYIKILFIRNYHFLQRSILMKELKGFLIEKHFYPRIMTRIFAVSASNIEEHTFKIKYTLF